MSQAINGKQLADSSVTETKLDPTYTAEVVKRNGSVAFTGTVSHGGQRITNVADPTSAQDAATRAYVDGVIASVPTKTAVRAATTANVTLSGTQTIDGVALTNERVLVKNQITASENGIYTVAPGAWLRTSDADASSELLGAIVFVSEGTNNGNKVYKQTTDAPITVGTSSIVWIELYTLPSVYTKSKLNKNMAGSTTTADGQAATATAIAATPAGYVWVVMNGVYYEIGDASKTLGFYFSGDGGATARAIGSIASGDVCYANGSVLGFQIATTDRFSFDFDA